MGNNLETKCDELYSRFGDLPREHSTDYPIWFGGDNEKSIYRVLVNKDKKGRKDSWKNLLVNYFKFPELDLSKDNKLKTNVWNTFFCSGYKVIDEENNRKITAYTPWYSFLLLPFIGGDLIIVKLDKNYHSPKKTYEEENKLNLQPSLVPA